MSIDLGFAPCSIDQLEVGIVDVPGHENFIKTMVAGAGSMDGVIFVVAADDGVMPQTKEHLDILTLLGIKHGLVALTKVDRVTAAQRQMARAQLQEFLRGTFLEDAPICPLSNVTGEGFDSLLDALKRLVRSIDPKRSDGLFRLPVERAFSIKGYGTVVAGIPVTGSVRLGDEVVLLPQGQSGRVKAIEVYKRSSDTALAGQCAALNIPQLDHNLITRGNTITIDKYFSPRLWYLCRLRLLAHQKLWVKNGQRVKFHVGASEVGAAVYLMQTDRLGPDEESIVQIRVNEPIVAGPKDRFIIRALAPVETIGGGMIIEALVKRLKRNRPEIQQDVMEQAEAVIEENHFVEYCLKKAEKLTASPLELAQRTKIPLRQTEEILTELIRRQRIIKINPELYLHAEVAPQIEQQLLQIVGCFHQASPVSPGITTGELLKKSMLSGVVLDFFLTRLKNAGRLAERNHRLALPQHRETYVNGERELIARVESLFLEQLFHPPRPEEITASTNASPETIQRIIQILTEHERLVPVEKNLLFHTDAIDQARQRLMEYIRRKGPLQSVDFKYLLDTTRKFAIPLLDYFDRTGLTRRVGYTRYLKANHPDMNSS